MTNLEERIIEAKRAYYEGHPIMDDFAYDALEEKLREENPDSFIFKIVGIQDFKASYEHKIPMLSNQKCLTDDALYDWLNKMVKKGFTTFNASSKADGMSLSLHYDKGLLIRGVSRGDGHIGTDITAKVSYFVPTKLNIDFTGEIRGEILMSYAGFEKLNAISPEPFTHPRNAAVGVINDDAINEERLSLLSFRVWKIINNSSLNDTANPWFEKANTITTDLDIAQELGFEVVENKEFELTGSDTTEIVSPILRYFESIKEDTYPKDGVVFRVADNNEFEDLGYTSHNPIGANAWKFAATQCIVTIKEIEWSVGTRDIQPVAHFEPTLLDGALIQAASLKSVKNMLDLGVTIGSKVIIRRSGGVIPAVIACAD